MHPALYRGRQQRRQTARMPVLAAPLQLHVVVHLPVRDHDEALRPADRGRHGRHVVPAGDVGLAAVAIPRHGEGLVQVEVLARYRRHRVRDDLRGVLVYVEFIHGLFLERKPAGACLMPSSWV